MNEVKHIHLGRQQFTVSLEAHGELKSYLDAITKQVGEAGSDVAEEVEMRMAELLTERGYDDKKVVLPKDVKFLKNQLGEPSDFSEDEKAGSKTSQPPEETTKRLFRDTDNAMIAGVAAGLAKYLAIDPVIVRILFVALVFLGGSGILIYILLWLLVPEAKTTSERLSMQGKAATVDNLKQVVERADVPAATRRAQGFLVKLFGIVGSIILIAVGLPLAIGAGAAILGVMASGAYIVMDGFKVAGHVVAPIGSHEVAGFVAGIVAALCILMFMMLMGIAMVRRRWQLPAWGVAALLGIFFLSAAVGGAFAADVEPAIRHRVEALQHTQTVQLAAFKSVTMNGSETNFSYVSDGKSYVKYHYFGSIHTDKLKNSVIDGKLIVNTTGADPYICNSFCVDVDPGITVEVHGPKLANLIVNGKRADLRRPCEVMNSDEMSVDCPEPSKPTPVLLVPSDN